MLKQFRKITTDYKLKRRNLPESFSYFFALLFWGIDDKLKEFNFKRKYLKKGTFNFSGAILPDISKNKDLFSTLRVEVFEDTFFIHCRHNDNYDKTLVDQLDALLPEGAYGYTDGEFDVTVKPGDIVIDAGAWIGDFSAFAACRGAKVYAFEPTNHTFQVLTETARLNNNRIIPIQKGLGEVEEECVIHTNTSGSAASSVLGNQFTSSFADKKEEKITITTIDSFVEENNLQSVDFIKADIEGFERYMLLGAKETLRRFAPKLAICTYHSQEDPRLLKQIILEANPDYKVVQKRKKLYASVIYANSTLNSHNLINKDHV